MITIDTEETIIWGLMWNQSNQNKRIEIKNEYIPMNQTQHSQKSTLPVLPNSEVKNFLTLLLNESGIETSNQELLDSMIADLYHRLTSYTTGILLQKLPEDAQEEFIQLLENEKDENKVEQFLQHHIPNVKEVLAQTFLEFRNLYLHGNE